MPNPVLTPAAAVGSGPALDARQVQVARAIADGGAHVVHGAPGSGKTHLAMALTVAEAERGGQPLLLVPTRTGAAAIRSEVTRRIGRTLDAAVVRTPAALAFAILRLRAAHAGEPAPTLISGPEQDQILSDLLAGHAAGEGGPITWPDGVDRQTWALQAFRNELRDVLMRAAEAGLSGAELSDLGRAEDRPEWVGAGQILTEYTQVMALGQITPDRGARYDAAGIVDEAVRALEAWESDLPGVAPPRWSLVVHDDYQDATLATARLLSVLRTGGATLAVLGDADAAVQSFRGGVPALLATAATPRPRRRGGHEHDPAEAVVADGAWGAREHVLDRVWRHGQALREPVRRLTGVLPVLAAGARREAAGEPDGDPADGDPADGDPADGARVASGLRTAVLGSPAQEVAYVARQLRIARLREQVPWSQMAVIARSSSQLGAIRRGLRAAGIPLALAAPDRPLRSEPAVRALLAALRAVLPLAPGDRAGRQAEGSGQPGDPGGLDLTTAVELLSGPIGALDAVALRGLRRHLRAVERQAGGTRTSAQVLLEVLTDPEATAALPPRYRRGPVAVARVLAATREAAEDPGATAETVLWAAWEATGLADLWQRRALAGGLGADRADADLDAVLALFRAAEQFMDRTAYSTPEAFVDHLLAQDFPADTLAARGQAADAVAVHTAAGAAGGQWEVVAVVGVQEDAWPDLRIRDTLLGAAALTDLVSARDVMSHSSQDGAERMRQARRDVADGELRAFVAACSRAQRLLYVTAVLDEDERPSMFLDLIHGSGEHQVQVVPAPLDLRGLVGQLRAALRPVLAADEPADGQEASTIAHASEAAAVLSHLVAHGVNEADPQHWGGLHDPSTRATLLATDQVPAIGPSAVEQLLTCPLRWVLTRHGGQPGTSDAQQLGNLIHEIAAAYPRGDVEAMRVMLQERWPDLGLAEGWVEIAHRARAEQMIDRLAQYMASRPGAVDVEVPFTVEVGGADAGGVEAGGGPGHRSGVHLRLRGQVDRVEHLTGGQVRIVDLKTGKNAESVAKAAQNPQLGAYQVATESGAFGPVSSAGAALVYPGTAAQSVTIRNQPPLAQADDPRWAHDLLAEAGRILDSGTFEARPNEDCRTCPVRTSCPAMPSGARVEQPR